MQGQQQQCTIPKVPMMLHAPDTDDNTAVLSTSYLRSSGACWREKRSESALLPVQGRCPALKQLHPHQSHSVCGCGGCPQLLLSRGAGAASTLC